MKPIRYSFFQMIQLIKHDYMLAAACLAPLLCGIFFKAGVPFLERTLAPYVADPAFLSPYYGLFDLTLSILTPVMLCFASAMIILEEMDDHIAAYLFVTPLGKQGYITSRLLLPCAAAFAAICVLLPVFTVSSISPAFILPAAACACALGILSSLLVISFSGNKLEGIAAAKLSSVTVIGIFVPFFMKGPEQYFFSFLPSYWMGKAFYSQNVIFFLPSLLLSVLCCFCLIRVFFKKAEK